MAEAAQSGSQRESDRWSLPHRIVFRFFFCLFVLYRFPYPISIIPKLGPVLADPYINRWNDGVTWVGAHVLHLTQPIAEASNGSGDRLFSWVEYGCFLSYSLLLTALWSVLDRKRPHYRTLHRWLMILVRFQLAQVMLGYGFTKVIKNQFPDPAPAKLLERVGDLSPMGLLWTFMGYSTSYTFFAGAGEVLGGLLLFFRRTTTLGALVIIGVMSNVVMLNFSYDVPVKLFSSHLLLMALYLVAPDARRLADVLVFNRSTSGADLRPPYRAKGLLVGGYLLKLAMLCLVVSGPVMGNFFSHQAIARQLAAHFNGVWTVQRFLRDGVEAPPLETDAGRWKSLAISWGKALQLRTMDDAIQSFGLNEEASSRLWTLTSYGKQPSLKLTYAEQDPAKLEFDPTQATAAADLTLEGTIDGAAVRIELRREDPSSFLLLSRGFHWVNEFPFNR